MPIIDDSYKLPKLPPETDEIVGIMSRGEALGASRNIRQINNIFLLTAKHWQDDDAQVLTATVLDTADYYIENRGKNTPAIGNAINKVLVGLANLNAGSVKEVSDFLENSCLSYNQKSIDNVSMISNLSANLMTSSKIILAYDYSSSMMAVLQELANRGLTKHLIVPESRDLDGGRPIVKEAIAMGHTVDFVIDMATAHFMPNVDAIIIGAETIFSNGGCWNTIGSFGIAVLAKYYNIPLYVPTEMIKIAPYSYKGIDKKMIFDDFSALLDYPDSFESPEKISVTAPAFDFVPPEMINAFITERGIINPYLLWNEAKNFLTEIGVDPLAE